MKTSFTGLSIEFCENKFNLGDIQSWNKTNSNYGNVHVEVSGVNRSICSLQKYLNSINMQIKQNTVRISTTLILMLQDDVA